MEFRIADTFTDSLGRLTGDEQKAVKTTAFDLQLNPASPGIQMHRLENTRDKNFWSARVTRDIRLILHRSESSLLLCYVDHHDDAYSWAARRKLETHPRTGAAQLVEIRETVQEVIVPRYIDEERVATPRQLPMLFDAVSDDQLLGYGVPPEWLRDVKLATEDSVLDIAAHLPAEAAEALLSLATGGKPAVREAVAAGADPFEHPDARRRFRTMQDREELELALDYPWEKWAIFLHPSQQELVERDFNGPARVSGSAGTGKTIVAVHRAVFLARANPEARVLLTTFSEPLANSLRIKLRRLLGTEPRLGERIEVHALDVIGRRLYERNVGPLRLASTGDVRRLIADSAGPEAMRFSQQFLTTEWDQVVDAWQLESWEFYRDVSRLGRKTRLPEAQRAALWSVFERVQAGLAAEGLRTMAQAYAALSRHMAGGEQRPFDHIIVDEAQDLSVAQLRFLASMGDAAPNALFFAGDIGQRIFQQPFSWRAMGVDIRGRSRTLRVNYRTSHQIRSQADRLLDPELSDVDGNAEDRRGTVSVFDGPVPAITVLATPEEEADVVARWLAERLAEGAKPHELGIFVRSDAEIDRALRAVESAGQQSVVLDEGVETTFGKVSLGTMHLAKGLEFRSVAVMACEDDVIPLQERIESVADEADLEDVYNTERQLLYVACTRARDHLLVSSGGPASEFLDDLQPREPRESVGPA